MDAQGGNPTLKNEHLAKLIEFKEIYELCDIGRVRNTNSKWFTYIKKTFFKFHPIYTQLYISFEDSSKNFNSGKDNGSYLNRSLSCNLLLFKRKNHNYKIRDFRNSIVP